MQDVGRFQALKSFGQHCSRSNVPARADHAHPRRRTKLSDFLANAACTDNANSLVPNNYRIVTVMIEAVPPLVAVTQVKPASKVEEACQDKLGHGASVRQAARGGHNKIGAPQIGVEEIARTRWSFVDPFQSRRTRSDIFHRRPAREHDFSRGQRMVALIDARRRIFPIAEIPIHRPLRLTSAQLTIKPSPGIDDFDPTVDVGDSVEHRVRHLWNHQDLDVLHSWRVTYHGKFLFVTAKFQLFTKKRGKTVDPEDRKIRELCVSVLDASSQETQNNQFLRCEI
jgi:hypothetical protein